MPNIFCGGKHLTYFMAKCYNFLYISLLKWITLHFFFNLTLFHALRKPFIFYFTLWILWSFPMCTNNSLNCMRKSLFYIILLLWYWNTTVFNLCSNSALDTICKILLVRIFDLLYYTTILCSHSAACKMSMLDDCKHIVVPLIFPLSFFKEGFQTCLTRMSYLHEIFIYFFFLYCIKLSCFSACKKAPSRHKQGWSWGWKEVSRSFNGIWGVPLFLLLFMILHRGLL